MDKFMLNSRGWRARAVKFRSLRGREIWQISPKFRPNFAQVWANLAQIYPNLPFVAFEILKLSEFI